MLTPLALPRRYLVGFDPRDLPHHFTDVLIIGGGIAGFARRWGSTTASGPGRHQGRGPREQQPLRPGGHRRGPRPGRSLRRPHRRHLGGRQGPCDPEVVELVVREAPSRIGELIEWGTHFDEVNGHVALTREGGHSHARIVHALGDETGREIMRAMIHPARAQPNVRLWQNSFTIDLLTHEGRCRGVLVWDRRRGLSLVWARAVVLATGGAGQLYRETTNPAIATGRRPRPGLSRRCRASRHGVHAVPSDRPLHCRLGPPPAHRGPSRRRGLPPRS